MKKIVKSIVLCLWCVLFISLTMIPGYGAQNLETSKLRSAQCGLKFNKNGRFKILIIADTQDNHRTQKDTILFIEQALEQEKPDLVVFLGDMVAGFGAWGIYPYIDGANEKNVFRAIDNIVGPVESANIPFAVVFGNHDAEEGVGVSKEKQFLMYQSYKNCLSYNADEGITGCGTYNLLIRDSSDTKNIFNLFFFDSGMYKTSMQDGEYANLGEDQLVWYENTGVSLAKQNNGAPMPSFAFQHIIVPEFYETMKAVPENTPGAIKGYKGFSDRYWTLDPTYEAGKRSLRDADRPELGKGRILEAPAPPSTSNGQFQGWKKQGDILAGFFGHDHCNEAVTRLHNIDLAYVPSSGFFMYNNGAQAAMRVVELNEENLSDYTTKLIFFQDVAGREPKNLTNASFNGNLTQCLLSMGGFLLCVLFLLVLVVYEIFSSIKWRKLKSNT